MTSHNNAWADFNDAPEQGGYDLIPAKTLAKVRLTLRPGGYDEPQRGWTGGLATRSATTGSVYLYCEFVVLEGPFAKRKVWSMIGLYSPKGPEWGNIGRSFLRAILNSARGIHPTDDSPTAQNGRRIRSFADLDGLVFAARIDVEKDAKQGDKNVIKQAIQPDHKEYAALMGGVARAASVTAPVSTAPVASAPAAATTPAAASPLARPTWAQ
jgi:hypothetical protein